MHPTPERDPEAVVERRLDLAGAPGIVWTPRDTSEPRPLVLLGHPGGLERMYPRLVGRAQGLATAGFAAATLELPGSGDRPRLGGVEQARADLRAALQEGRPVTDDIVDRLVLPLVDQAVPEWQAAVDELLTWPGIRGPVGVAGGLISLGTRFVLVEQRAEAAVLFAGSYVPRRIFEEARRVVVPLLVLLQWDDEGNDRQAALDLFDAFGSEEKSLHANLGGHTGVPAHEGDDVTRFLHRHLRGQAFRP